MSMSTEAIDIIDNLQKDGINRETAKELIDFVEKQQGDLATKQDIKDMATKQDIKDMATKQDIKDMATKQDIGDLAAKVREIAVKQDYLKWIMGIGFVALLSLMIYLHSDTKAEMNRRFAEQKAEISQRFTKMEAEMKEIKQLLQRERK